MRFPVVSIILVAIVLFILFKSLGGPCGLPCVPHRCSVSLGIKRGGRRGRGRVGVGGGGGGGGRCLCVSVCLFVKWVQGEIMVTCTSDNRGGAGKGGRERGRTEGEEGG